MTREVLLPDELSDPRPHNHSHAIVEGGQLHVSGQVAVDGDGNRVGDDVETQARQAFANLGHILDTVDRDISDVVKLTSYLVDAQGDYEEFMNVYEEVFDAEPYPCHTILGVDTLPSPELLVELEIEVPIEE